MATLVIRHKVADYSKWRPAFDEHGATRKAAGCKGGRVLRNSNDPSEVIVVLDWDNHENAQKFAASPNLKEVMQQAGVIDQPDVYFMDDEGKTSQ